MHSEMMDGGTMDQHHDNQDAASTAFVAAALDALRLSWSDGYEIGCDDEVWWYRRRDGKGGTQTAPYPDELNKMITDDHAFIPVRGDSVSGRVRPALSTVPDEPDEVPRLHRFRGAHPKVRVAAGFGYWQAVIPETNGETVITRYLLRELLDKLEKLLDLHVAPGLDGGTDG
jgi:hypothetical protein